MCSKKNIQTIFDQSINNIIEKEGFIQYDVNKKCLSTNGSNYLGELYEIDIKGKTNEGDRELNIFVKSIVTGENKIKIFSLKNVYKTELYFYKELSKIFDELQEESQVPINERYKTAKSYDESNTEAIIMENLSRKGFTTWYRMDAISLKFAEMAIRELAKFHALSFALKVNRPDYFESRIKTMKSAYVTGEDLEGFVQNMLSTAMQYVDNSVKDRIQRFCEDLADKFAGNYVDKIKQRCLCYGDYRPSNILTKLTNGEASEIIPVDYQLLYYGCPVLDFIFFIVTSTDRDFRRENLSHLKDLYFETMTQFLKYFNIDVDLVYSRKEFDEDYKDKIDYGLMVVILILPFLFTPENDVPDTANEEWKDLSFRLDDRFKERFCGIIEDYVEWGVL